jgi:hypothetical protein
MGILGLPAEDFLSQTVIISTFKFLFPKPIAVCWFHCGIAQSIANFQILLGHSDLIDANNFTCFFDQILRLDTFIFRAMNNAKRVLQLHYCQKILPSEDFFSLGHEQLPFVHERVGLLNKPDRFIVDLFQLFTFDEPRSFSDHQLVGLMSSFRSLVINDP